MQDWLGARFGATGSACYSTVIGLRLLSEVFANLLVVGLIIGRRIALWSYPVAFGAAMAGAVTYFARDTDWALALLPDGHKYEQLLVICVAVLIVAFAALLAGARRA